MCRRGATRRPRRRPALKSRHSRSFFHGVLPWIASRVCLGAWHCCIRRLSSVVLSFYFYAYVAPCIVIGRCIWFEGGRLGKRSFWPNAPRSARRWRPRRLCNAASPGAGRKRPHPHRSRRGRSAGHSAARPARRSAGSRSPPRSRLAALARTSSPKRSTKPGLTRNSTRSTSGTGSALRRIFIRLATDLRCSSMAAAAASGSFAATASKIRRCEAKAASSAPGARSVIVRWLVSHSTSASWTAVKIGFAGGLCQHVMEGDIGALETRDVAARGRVRLERVPQPLDVVTVGAHRRETGDPDLE